MKRSRVLALAGLLLFIGIFPTLATEIGNVLNPDPVVSADPAPPTDAPMATPSDAPSPSPTTVATQSSAPNADAESSSDPSPSPSETPAAPLESQPSYVLHFPQSVPVDPRAKAFFLPSIYASSDNSIPTLVCIKAGGALIDVGAKRIDNAEIGTVGVKGDMSDFLILQGSTAAIVQAINSSGGLKIYSDIDGISNRILTFQFVGLNKPALNSHFCGAASSVAWTSLRPLGLDQNVIKGSGVLKR